MRFLGPTAAFPMRASRMAVRGSAGSAGVGRCHTYARASLCPSPGLGSGHFHLAAQRTRNRKARSAPSWAPPGPVSHALPPPTPQHCGPLDSRPPCFPGTPGAPGREGPFIKRLPRERPEPRAHSLKPPVAESGMRTSATSGAEA